ncbi:MAG: hypothetical protein ACYDH9_27210 [Limisphaerales bacterium]
MPRLTDQAVGKNELGQLEYERIAFSSDRNITGSMNQEGVLPLRGAPSWKEIAAARARGVKLGRPVTLAGRAGEDFLKIIGGFGNEKAFL